MKRVLTVIFIALILVSSCRNSKNGRIESFPTAEWNPASAVLMHTPGMELFDGVIHPSAGLFENYFNVDSAALEHELYVKTLEKNGIEVYKVTDILMDMDIEKLRELAEQTLLYDVSGVKVSDTLDFGESYRQQVLSVMSKKDLIRVLILQPEVILHSTDNNTMVEAEYVHHPLMNLYFTRDQSISTPKGQIICKMNSSQRSPETRIIKACYEHCGIKPILEITGEGRLEGGDYIPAGNVSFIGCGMRTNMEAINQMLEADVFGHDTVIVVKDHLRWQMEMHLDTHFNIIDKDLCTMQLSRMIAKKGEPAYCTVDIYARGKGRKEYSLIKEDAGFVETVKSMGFKIISICREDELHYANNYLTIAPRHIIAVKGQSEKYRKDLEENGVTVEWIPLENLIDGYGAAHCMTQVTRRYQ